MVFALRGVTPETGEVGAKRACEWGLRRGLVKGLRRGFASVKGLRRGCVKLGVSLVVESGLRAWRGGMELVDSGLSSSSPRRPVVIVGGKR